MRRDSWAVFTAFAIAESPFRISSILGTLAAAFQSYMYGAFTPAGGVFATLTSMAMVGTMQPIIFVAAACLSTVAAVVVWACGVGR